jgi:hypothetical protein
MEDKFTITFPEEARDEIEGLSQELGISSMRVIARALNLLRTIERDQAEGGRVIIEKTDGNRYRLKNIKEL